MKKRNLAAVEPSTNSQCSDNFPPPHPLHRNCQQLAEQPEQRKTDPKTNAAAAETQQLGRRNRRPIRLSSIGNDVSLSVSRSSSIDKMSIQPPSQSPTTTKSKRKASQNTQTSQGFKARWDAKSTEIFVKLCVEQVKAGHRPGTHLDRIGWEAIINKFKIATGKSYVRLQLKNRWDTLKKEWGLWKNLLRGETGLGLDPLTGAIMASDDWWNLKLQRYPDAVKFREKPLTMANDMDILFSDVSAIGQWAHTPSSGGFIDTEASHTPLGDDTDTEEVHPSELGNQHHQKRGPTKKQKGYKKSTVAGELRKTLNCIVDAVETSSSTSAQNVAMQNPYTITECLAKISTIPGVSEDDDLLVWAARLFMKSSLRESFMALPNDALRLKFINLEIASEKARIPGYRN